VALGARGARFGALAEHADDELQLGDPTDVTIRFDGAWRRAGGMVEIPEVHATLAGAALSGSLALRNLDTDPVVDLALGVQHLDFAQLLGATGLGVPESLGVAPGGGRDLGSASIDVRVRGRPADPASLSVSQKIDFKPPRQMPPAILRLRDDFVFSPQDGSGPHRPIDVSPASPDFIALRERWCGARRVDNHPAASQESVPVARQADWTQAPGTGDHIPARVGAWQESHSRDLPEHHRVGTGPAWPAARGPQPAARSYFSREPQALTPAEMAFLVAIIPGPIKYQSSFAHGSPGPGLRSLIDELLAKLRSVDAIGEEDYRQALDEPIVVASGRPRE